MSNLLNEDARLAVQHGILLRDLDKTNKILSGTNVETVVRPDYQMPYGSPAMTDAQSKHGITTYQIALGQGIMPKTMTPAQLVPVMGVNYHELCHVIYTYLKAPRNFNHHLRTYSIQGAKSGAAVSACQKICNILEDARIETLFTERYPSSRAYFQASSNKFILNNVQKITGDDPKSLESAFGAYFLICGRRYISQSVLDALRPYAVKYVGEDVLREVEDAVRAYVDLGLDITASTGAERVIQIAHLLIQNDMQDGLQEAPDHHDTEDNVRADPEALPPMPEGFGKPQEDENDEDADESGEGAESDADGSEGVGEGDDEGDESNADGDSDGDSEDADGEAEDGDGSGQAGDDQKVQEGEGEGEGVDEDTDEGRSEGSSAEQGSADGAGSDNNELLSGKEIEDVLEDDTNYALSDESVQQDLQQRVSAIGKMKNEKHQSLSQGFYNEHPITPEMLATARKLSKVWTRVSTLQDPGRRRHQSSGMVNMHRVMQGSDLDSVFDSWDEGQQDATDIELVCLIDTSGSMGMVNEHGDSRALLASRAIWAMTRAANMASSSISVSQIAFDAESKYFQPRGSMASRSHFPMIWAGGGTNPRMALLEASAIFATSTKKKKQLVILTDGFWSETEFNNKLIQNMNASGISTALAFYNEKSPEEFILHMKRIFGSAFAEDTDGNLKHYCQVFHQISDYRALVAFVEQVVTNLLNMKG